MKKKIIQVFVVICMIISAVILHELIFLLTKFIPYPIVLGMLGGWGLTYLYYRK